MSMPITAYFWDNGQATLYNLTVEQIEKLNNENQEVLEKFEIKAETFSGGYAPDWLLLLAEATGAFEVGSI